MRALLIIILIFTSNRDAFSQIMSAEYFYDTDPGFGNGSPLNITGNTIDANISIPTTGLSEGVHKVYVRVLNQDGTWGLHAKHVVYVSATTNNTASVASAEYFYDTDPGLGNGSPLNITGSIIDQDLSIPTTGLTNGVHKLYMRLLNSDGAWSLYGKQIVYVSLSNTNTATIVSAEYFFDVDPGVGNAYPVNLMNGVLVDEDLALNVPNDLPSGDHIVYMRTLNESGIWSLHAVSEVSTTLSVNDLELEALKLYPNPVKDILYFETNDQAITDCKVIDATGKVVQVELPNTFKLDLGQLPSGIYLIYLKTGIGSVSKKIIKL